MRRHLLGIIAFALLAGGTWLWIGGDSSTSDGAVQLAGIAIRAGAVMAAIWLALPQLEQLFLRVPPWLAAGCGVLGLILVVRPKLVLVLGPLLALLAVLHWMGGLRPPPSKR